jgi:hypothetical protein
MLVPHEVCIQHACFLSLVAPVEDLKDVSADKLVISVDGDHNRVLSAVIERPHVDVLQGSHSLAILDESVTLFVDTVEGKIVAIDCSTAVSGLVVNKDYFVIAVVL